MRTTTWFRALAACFLQFLVADSIASQAQSFSLSPAPPLTLFVGASGSAQVAVNSLSGFNSPVTLSVLGMPPGMAASFSANQVTPPAGGSAYSTLTLGLSPAVTPSKFVLKIFGTSGASISSVSVAITVMADVPSVENVLSQISTAGCINNSQLLQAMTSGLVAAQREISAGQIHWAVNTLHAIFFELSILRCTQHFLANCNVNGVPTNPTVVLRNDLAAVMASLYATPDPVMGYVVNAASVGVSGATVSIFDSSNRLVASEPTDVTGFYFFPMTDSLIKGAAYSASVTGMPKGYQSSSAPQTFLWRAQPISLADFVLKTVPPFTISRTVNPPDAIAGHAYAVYIATSLASGNAGGDVVNACSLFGTVPAGMSTAPGILPGSGSSPYYCVLSMASAPAAGQFGFTLQTTDGSNPVQTASQAYVLTIRPDFSFTTSALAPGVQGRSYGVSPLSQPETTNIGTTQGGLTAGNAPLTGCTLAGPSNLGLSVSLDATKTQCLLSSASLTSSGAFTVIVSAVETPVVDPVTNLLAVPAGATTPVTSALPLTVNPPLTLNSNQGSLWPAAVIGRAYGTGTGCSNGACLPVIYTASGGVGGYTFPASTPSSMPAGMVCPAVSGSATYTCAAPSMTAVPGAYSPSVTVTDTGNTAIPSGSLSLASSITVNAEMSVTPPPIVPPAVRGRAYGTGSGCSGLGGTCAPLKYVVSNGLGNYTATGTSLMPAGDNFVCTVAASTFSCSSPSITDTAGTAPTLTFVAAETGNTATPGQTAPPDTSKALAVNPEMTVTPPASVPAAVNGRAFGIGTGCSGGSCQPLQYSVAGGLGNYTLTGSALTAGTDTFACTLASPTFSCAVVAIKGAGGTAPTLNFVAAESGNTSTPGNTRADTSQTLNVRPPLTVSVSIGGISYTTSQPWPAGVTGRSYGVGGGCSSGTCSPVVYAASGGLAGGYTFSSFYTLSGLGFTCIPDVPAPNSTTATCSSSSVTAGAGSSNPSISATDTANASVPQATVVSDPASRLFSSLTISPEMTFSTSPNALPTAVNGRSYGVGSSCGASGTSACAPLSYTVLTGSGLGGYSFALSISGSDGGFSCLTDASTGNCTSAGVIEAPGTYGAMHASVTDTANAATPSNILLSANATFTVNAPLVLTPPPSFPDFPDGENNVSYGSAGSGCVPGNVACTPLKYAVPFVSSTIAGLPPYAFTSYGFPSGLNCSQSNAMAPAPNGTILTCSAATGISAPGPFPQVFSPSVQVTDTPNASVPAATTSSGPANLTVDSQLRILDTDLPNGLVGFQYYPSGSGVTIKSRGGIGSTTWVGPGDGASGACAAPDAATLPGFTAMTFNSATQVFSTNGSAFESADASVIDGAYTFQVCVSDAGNEATPQTAALPNPGASAPLVANHFVFDVLNTYAYTAETSLKAVDVMNTTTSEMVGAGISLGAAPTMHPNGVAVSPDGAHVYVTLSNNKFAVIDTITNAQIPGSPFAMPTGSTCTSLAGVAMTNDGRAYFACPTSSGTGGVVDVVSTVDNATLITELATGNAPSGVAISPTVNATTGKTSQVYVDLNDVNELVVISNSETPAVSTTIPLSPVNAGPLGLTAVMAGSDVYVYLAKTVAGTGDPGIEIVDVTATNLLNEIGLVPSTLIPVSVAATPDGSEVYGTLNDPTLGQSYVIVIDNGTTPTLRTLPPYYGLPDPMVYPPLADTGATGIAIPPLAGVAPDFRIFVAQAISGDIAVLLDNQGAGNKPLVEPAIALKGSNPAPQGIAGIPLPTGTPKLP